MSADNGIFVLELHDMYVIKETNLSMLDDMFYDEDLMIQESRMIPKGIKNVFSNHHRRTKYEDAMDYAQKLLRNMNTEYGINIINATDFTYSEIFA